MPGIASELLKNDKKLIILAEILEYCEKRQVDRIRFSELRSLCDQKIRDLDHMGEAYGGNFTAHLKLLQGDELTPGSRKYLRIEKVSYKPNSLKFKTWIVPDLEKIKSYIEALRHVESSRDMQYKTLDDSSLEKRALSSKPFETQWREIIRSNINSESSVSSLLDKTFRHRKDREFMINAVADVQSQSRPRRWRLSYLSPHDKSFTFSGDEAKLLIRLQEKMQSSNPFPFTFVIDYLGPHDVSSISTDVFPEMFKKEINYFVKWCIHFKNHSPTEHDVDICGKWLSTPHEQQDPNGPRVDEPMTGKLFANFLESYVKIQEIAAKRRFLPN